MTRDRTETPLDELNTILDRERQALLTGDLERLTGLLAPKEDLLTLIGDLKLTDTAMIEEMNSKLRRNQQLLDGALDGIRSVAARLASLRDSTGAFETYGADGKRRDLPVSPDTSVERRA